MDKLKRKVFVSELIFLLIAGGLIFIPAWTVFYWQGWLFLMITALSLLLMSLYFLQHDRALMERRVNIGPKAEKKFSQKILMSLLTILLIGLVLLSSLDHRFHLSNVPGAVVIVSNLMILAGFYIIFRVFRENSFASATVGLTGEQKVIATGPYSVVRHPMYSGSLIVLLFTPVALDSLWGIIPSVGITVLVVFRILDEEKFLNIHLPGYDAYRKKIKYRLIPYVW